MLVVGVMPKGNDQMQFTGISLVPAKDQAWGLPEVTHAGDYQDVDSTALGTVKRSL
jgi:hypothetical protein